MYYKYQPYYKPPGDTFSPGSVRQEFTVSDRSIYKQILVAGLLSGTSPLNIIYPSAYITGAQHSFILILLALVICD